MIQIGFGQQDITPASSVDLCGFALRQNPGSGIHDPLKIRWIALRDSRCSEFLLGSADLISFSRQSYQSLKKRINAESTSPCCQVALATTHTHSAPVTVRLRYCGKVNKEYLAGAKDKIVESAVSAASATPSPVIVKLGTSTCDVSFNRRHRDTGKPANHEVITLAFVDPETGSPRAIITNYACHPVVLGHLSNAVSADYPGYLASFVEQKTGAPCLFLNGAAGDVNPDNEHCTDPSEARKTGERIGKAALEALSSAWEVDSSYIAWHRVQVELPVRVPKSPADFKKRLAMLEERFGISGSLFQDRLERDIQRLKDGTYPRSVALELSLLEIGSEVAILFVPGELFTSIGQRMQAMAEPRKLIISGFSNGSVGYLSDRQAYEDGGYEPLFANFFYDFPEFDPSIEDVLLDGVERLLAKTSATAPAAM